MFSVAFTQGKLLLRDWPADFIIVLSFDKSQQRSHLHLLRKRSVVLIVIQELFRYNFRQIASKKNLVKSPVRICYYAFWERKTHTQKKLVKTGQVTIFLRGDMSKTTDVRFKNNIWENREKPYIQVIFHFPTTRIIMQIVLYFPTPKLVRVCSWIEKVFD